MMVLTESWQKKEMRQVGEVITGTTPSTKKTEYYGDQYKLISPADLDNGKYVTTAHRMLSSLGLQQCRILPKDTVLVGCIGNVGKIGLTADEKAATNQQINAVVCNNDNDPHFVYYALLFNRHKLENAAVKTTLPILNKSNFEHFDLDIPFLPEQRRIANILSSVQTAIERQTRLIAITQELKRALMHKLFTEGLRGEKQKMTEIGPVPESWDVLPLDTCAIVQTGTAKGRKIADDESLELPYLRVANVQDGYLDLAEIKTIKIRANEKERYLLKKGDVVLTEGGDFDKLGRGFIWQGQIENCVHQNHIFAVRVNRDKLLPAFFAYQSQSPYGKKYFLSVAHKTSNLACINTAKLKRFPVLVPKLKEQEQITDILQTIERKLSIHSRRLALIEDLFRTLLNQLMTGQIRVNDIDLPGLS